LIEKKVDSRKLNLQRDNCKERELKRPRPTTILEKAKTSYGEGENYYRGSIPLL
jgi:hypothetical protein